MLKIKIYLQWMYCLLSAVNGMNEVGGGVIKDRVPIGELGALARPDVEASHWPKDEKGCQKGEE